MDWRTLFERHQRAFYDLLYVGALLRGAALYNIGYAPLDPSIATGRLTRRQPYQYQLYARCADEILSLAPTSRRVVEIGSGLGAGARFVEARYKIDVVAMEPNAVARLISRRVFGKPALAARAPELPFAPGSVDAYFMIDSTVYFFGEAFFQSVRRTLKPGGVVIVADFRKKPYANLRKMFVEAFAGAGFVDVRARDLTANALRACAEDERRRRAFLRGMPKGLREEMAYSFGLPESAKFQEMAAGERSYILASARNPGPPAL